MRTSTACPGHDVRTYRHRFLYGKRALLEKMPPYCGGGEMIRNVTSAKTNELPYKFEAGTSVPTPSFYAKRFYWSTNRKGNDGGLHEQQLLNYAAVDCLRLKGVRLIGTAIAK